jgi:hypothetical protein
MRAIFVKVLFTAARRRKQFLLPYPRHNARAVALMRLPICIDLGDLQAELPCEWFTQMSWRCGVVD